MAKIMVYLSTAYYVENIGLAMQLPVGTHLESLMPCPDLYFYIGNSCYHIGHVSISIFLASPFLFFYNSIPPCLYFLYLIHSFFNLLMATLSSQHARELF